MPAAETCISLSRFHGIVTSPPFFSISGAAESCPGRHYRADLRRLVQHSLPEHRTNIILADSSSFARIFTVTPSCVPYELQQQTALRSLSSSMSLQGGLLRDAAEWTFVPARGFASAFLVTRSAVIGTGKADCRLVCVQVPCTRVQSCARGGCTRREADWDSQCLPEPGPGKPPRLLSEPVEN